MPVTMLYYRKPYALINQLGQLIVVNLIVIVTCSTQEFNIERTKQRELQQPRGGVRGGGEQSASRVRHRRPHLPLALPPHGGSVLRGARHRRQEGTLRR